jgi:hypothetical protein
MFEKGPTPVFEARSLSSASGWYVRVVWPHGHIPGFVSHREATRWINEKAQAWVSERISAEVWQTGSVSAGRADLAAVAANAGSRARRERLRA